MSSDRIDFEYWEYYWPDLTVYPSRTPPAGSAASVANHPPDITAIADGGDP